MSDPVEEALRKAHARDSNRVYYTFTVPEKYSSEIKSISLVELTAREEEMATKRVGTNFAALPNELARECIRRVNDTPVRTSDNSVDKWWDTMPPTVRKMVAEGYAKLHMPDPNDVSSFLGSMSTGVG